MPDAVVHVVDDDASVREATALLLKIDGYSTFEWASGDQFLAAADLHYPGCVLLDLRMPGSSGFAVIGELQRRSVNMPVILMTGHGDAEIESSAVEASVFAYLEKPYDAARLIELVEKCVSWALSEQSN